MKDAISVDSAAACRRAREVAHVIDAIVGPNVVAGRIIVGLGSVQRVYSISNANGGGHSRAQSAPNQVHDSKCEIQQISGVDR